MNLAKFLLVLLFIQYTSGSYAQDLFSYGNHPVSREEFLKAFLKNNNQKKFSEKDYRDYLELYIRFKLKVQAAYDQQLDTLASQKTELNDFRNQVIEEFLNDQQSLDKLVKEAFDRSQKEIHLAHIFIPLSTSPADTVRQEKFAMEAFSQLKKGMSFKEAAMRYSADTSVRVNGGVVGWITAFTLPYQFENIIYNLPAGKFSQPFKSSFGYHIFQNGGERKATGKLRVAQILFALPPGADQAARMLIQQKADSVYSLLIKGAPFSEMVTRYSDDRTTKTTSGELPEFGPETYDTHFSDVVFALTRKGDITKPVTTAYGYHIVKLLERIPVNTNSGDQEALALLKQQVRSDARIGVAQQEAKKKMAILAGYRKASVDQKALLLYTDSALAGKKFTGITDRTPLFFFKSENIYAGDWIRYLQFAGGSNALHGSSFNALMDQFTQSTVDNYYKAHLEQFNPAFAAQMKEFKEGNLLFEIMQRTIWQKAAADTIALLDYYQRNKNKYWWESSAEAVVFTCKDSATARELRNRLEQNRKGWRVIVQSYNESVQADSARFELTQLPVPDHAPLAASTITEPVRSSLENNSVLFAYITRVYREREPRSFNDSKGFVLNDYQGYLEDKWIESLKVRYPVKVNDTVFRTLR